MRSSYAITADLGRGTEVTGGQPPGSSNEPIPLTRPSERLTPRTRHKRAAQCANQRQRGAPNARRSRSETKRAQNAIYARTWCLGYRRLRDSYLGTRRERATRG